MGTPSTRALDHIVYLTVPGTLKNTAEYFRELGFSVITGGTHADGLTANSLVILSDGVYLELIAFTKPVEAYPPSSPERRAREAHRWASKSPGFVDYAFLGNGSENILISDIINKRAAADGIGELYQRETKGGRERPDGVVLKWLISAPYPSDDGSVNLPFFCGDVTPRELRVQTDPPSNTSHRNSATGVAHVKFITDEKDLPSLARRINAVVGDEPLASYEGNHSWKLKSPLPSSHERFLHISPPQTSNEKEFLEKHGQGIYEIGFYVSGNNKEPTQLPHGSQLTWLHETEIGKA